MERELDRDDYTLRVLIETMQREGRSERAIETAVREASGQMQRAASRPSRRLVRLGLPRRARKRVDATNVK